MITAQTLLAGSKIEFIGYATTFEVVIVIAGLREAAEKCAPSLLPQIHSSSFLEPLLPRTPLLFTITVPPDITSNLEERVVSAKYQFGEVFLRMCKFCLPFGRLIWLQCC
jgi:hypothetical protein